MAYKEPEQKAVQPQQGGQQEYYPEDDYGYQYAGDMWRGQKSQDPALHVREATYAAVDELHDNEKVFDEWVTSRRLMLARAPRMPGIDSKMYNRLSRKFKFIVARAHSEGKRNILRSMCEAFDFDMELLVSKADLPMQGISGIGALTTQNINQKQEIRMPQQSGPRSIFSGLADMLPGAKR